MKKAHEEGDQEVKSDKDSGDQSVRKKVPNASSDEVLFLLAPVARKVKGADEDKRLKGVVEGSTNRWDEGDGARKEPESDESA